MEYYKIENDDYILAIGRKKTGGNISREEYAKIFQMGKKRKKAPEGYTYMLKKDLSGWDLVELPQTEEIEEE